MYQVDDAMSHMVTRESCPHSPNPYACPVCCRDVASVAPDRKAWSTTSMELYMPGKVYCQCLQNVSPEADVLLFLAWKNVNSEAFDANRVTYSKLDCKIDK